MGYHKRLIKVAFWQSAELPSVSGQPYLTATNKAERMGSANEERVSDTLQSLQQMPIYITSLFRYQAKSTLTPN